jgi:hypothetical protein
VLTSRPEKGKERKKERKKERRKGGGRREEGL